MGEKTKVLSVHRLRRVARNRERHITAALAVAGQSTVEQGLLVVAASRRSSRLIDVPAWTRGVRVEKAGPFQYAVVATSRAGH